MLLEPLVATIQNLKRSIEAHETSLRENEIRTRMALIDPLLSILGWDTSDPELVLPEYTVSGRADYALLKPDGRPAAFIEAKKLGEPLEQHRMQMLNYSNAAGVDYAGLTNGNQWEFYSVFERGTLDQRLLLQTNIVSANPYHCALGFLLLWRPNLASGDPTKSPVPALAPLPVDTPSPPRGEHSLSQTHSAMSSNAIDPAWTPLSRVDPARGDVPPKGIKIDQGPAIEINSWVRVLIETTEWLCRQGRLTSRDCPIEIGKTRNLVAAAPVHRHGTAFKRSHSTSNGLFLEMNFSSRDCVNLSQLLLKRCGVEIDALELRFG